MGTLLNKNPTPAIADDDNLAITAGPRRSRPRRRDSVLKGLLECGAVTGEGAGVAGGRTGCADDGAKFHEALVEGCRVDACRGGGGDQSFGPGPGPADPLRTCVWEGSSSEAHQDAGDVAIDDRDRPMENDGTEGACRVPADAGERLEIGGVARDLAVKDLDDVAGGGVQIPGAPVIPQTGPRGEDFAQRRGSEGLEGGERGEEEGESLQHPRDLGLLEHELRDEGDVGVAGRGPPGERAGGSLEPAGEGTGEDDGLVGVMGGHGVPARTRS